MEPGLEAGQAGGATGVDLRNVVLQFPPLPFQSSAEMQLPSLDCIPILLAGQAVGGWSSEAG